MTLENIKIRKAGNTDADLIADLSRETFYEAVGPFNTKENMDVFMNQQFSRDQLIAEVFEKNHIFLVADFEDTPAGYAKLRMNRSLQELGGLKALEIARIYVSKRVIGLGLGKALMQGCLEIAIANGMEVVWLGVWEKNQKAIGFYQHCGFERFGEHIFLLGNDPQTDWLMKKTLPVF